MGRAPQWLAVILGGFVLSACSGPAKTVVTPEARALRQLSELQDAVRKTRALPYQQVRFNPVNCNCPVFEVLVQNDTLGRQRWVRCTLEPALGESPVVEQLTTAAQLEQKSGKLSAYWVVGELDRELYADCENGAPCLHLTVEEFYREPPTLLLPAQP